MRALSFSETGLGVAFRLRSDLCWITFFQSIYLSQSVDL